MNCYRVKVKTTNASRHTTYASGGEKSGYLTCRGGVLYVMGERFADVEKVVDVNMIEEIEFAGPGYSA